MSSRVQDKVVFITGGGSIINISSIAGLVGFKNRAANGAAFTLDGGETAGNNLRDDK